jgi:hypothetical protein
MQINKNQVPRSVLDLYEVPNPKFVELCKLGKSTRYCPKTKSLIYNDLLPPGALYWSALAGEKINNEKPFKTKIELKDKILIDDKETDLTGSTIKIKENANGVKVVYNAG